MACPINLSWARFSLLALVLAGITAIIVASSQSGLFDPPNLSLALLATSLLLFFAYRWHRLRTDFSSGRLTEAGFRSAPRSLILGPLRYAVLWFIVTLILTFLPILVWALKQ